MGENVFLGKEWQNRFRIFSLKLDNRQWLQKIDIEIGNKLNWGKQTLCLAIMTLLRYISLNKTCSIYIPPQT